MAASCCSSAIPLLPRASASARARYGLVSPHSASHSRPSNRFGLSVRDQRRPEARKSGRVSCIGGDNKTAAVTGKSWEKCVLESEIPVLVEFYTSWCGPCRMVHRVIDEIAIHYSGRLKCYLLNADNDPKIAEDYRINAVPVVLLFKNGQKLDSVVGTMPKEFYVAAIERVFTCS